MDNNHTETMLEDIVSTTGYKVGFLIKENVKYCYVWVSDSVLFARYAGASFIDALRKAWQEICG